MKQLSDLNQMWEWTKDEQDYIRITLTKSGLDYRAKVGLSEHSRYVSSHQSISEFVSSGPLESFDMPEMVEKDLKAIIESRN